MTLNSINETVAILYDIENAPFEMLNYTLGKARRFQPCRTIVVSDWEARPEQKRWDRLMRRPGFTFRQISRTYLGKNSLDSAIYDSAKLLYDEGVRKFLIITTDSDFVRIAELLNSETPSYIIGVGTKQASETLRSAYNEFFVYPPEEKKPVKKETARKEAPAAAPKERDLHEEQPAAAAVKKPKAKAAKTVKPVVKEAPAKTANPAKPAKQVKKTAKKQVVADTVSVMPTGKTAEAKPAKTASPVKVGKAAKQLKQPKSEKLEKPVQQDLSAKTQSTGQPTEGSLVVRLPKTLRKQLEDRRQEEEVSMDELMTYLIMRGLSR